jgi:hypothetical protein
MVAPESKGKDQNLSLLNFIMSYLVRFPQEIGVGGRATLSPEFRLRAGRRRTISSHTGPAAHYRKSNKHRTKSVSRFNKPRLQVT